MEAGVRSAEETEAGLSRIRFRQKNRIRISMDGRAWCDNVFVERRYWKRQNETERYFDYHPRQSPGHRLWMSPV